MENKQQNVVVKYILDMTNYVKGTKVMEKANKALNASMGSLNNLMMDTISVAKKAGGYLGGTFSKVWEGLTSTFGLTAMAMTAIISTVGKMVDSFKEAYKGVGDLESAIKKLDKSFKNGGKSVDEYRMKFAKMASDSGQSTMDLAENVKLLIRENYSLDEAMAITAESAKLATKSNIDLGESNKYISTTMKVFGKDARDLNEIMGQSDYLVSNFGADVDEVRDIMAEVGVEFVKSGGSLSEFNAIVAGGIKDGEDWENITKRVEDATEDRTKALDSDTLAIKRNLEAQQGMASVDYESMTLDQLKEINKELKIQLSNQGDLYDAEKKRIIQQIEYRKNLANYQGAEEALAIYGTSGSQYSGSFAGADKNVEANRKKIVEVFDKHGRLSAIAYAKGMKAQWSEEKAMASAMLLSENKSTPSGIGTGGDLFGGVDPETVSSDEALDAYNLERLRKEVAYEKFKLGIKGMSNKQEQILDTEHQMEMAKMDMDYYNSQKDMDAEALKAQANYLKQKQKLNKLEADQEADKFDLLGILGDAGSDTAKDIGRQLIKDGEVNLKEMGALALENIAMSSMESGTRSLLEGLKYTSAMNYPSATIAYRNSAKAFAIGGVAGLGAGALNNSIEEDKEDFDSYEEQVDQIEEEVIQEESQECTEFIVQGFEPFLDALREHSLNKYNYDIIATTIGKKRR